MILVNTNAVPEAKVLILRVSKWLKGGFKTPTILAYIFKLRVSNQLSGFSYLPPHLVGFHINLSSQ
jgi:hypothetical protein